AAAAAAWRAVRCPPSGPLTRGRLLATDAHGRCNEVPRSRALGGYPWAGVTRRACLKIRWPQGRGSSSLPPGTREITGLAAPGGLLAAGVSMNVSMNFPALSRRARSERQLAALSPCRSSSLQSVGVAALRAYHRLPADRRD